MICALGLAIRLFWAQCLNFWANMSPIWWQQPQRWGLNQPS